MADLVRVRHRLPTIKLSTEFQSSYTAQSYSTQLTHPTVLIEIERGSQVIASISAQLNELGVPDDFDPSAYRYAEPEFNFSPEVGRDIMAGVTTLLGKDTQLWLQLADPAGFLSVLPLERMLSPFVDNRPIVRIPNFTLSPAAPAGPVEIAMCLSEPMLTTVSTSPLLPGYFIRSLGDVYPDLVIHLFADSHAYAEITADQGFERIIAGVHLVMHDPSGAPQAPRTTPGTTVNDSGTAVSNPWLLWMLQELDHIAVDIIHFISHGYTRNGQSALALAESPAGSHDSLWARFVSPNQVATTLARLGAWAIGFTSPAKNISSMGLRKFFDDTARLRAGPIIYHDAGLDPYSSQAARAYAGLLAGEPPGRLPAVSMYANPTVFSADPHIGEVGLDSFASTLVDNSLALPLTRTSPAWLTSTRRYLEQSVATMFPEQAEPLESAGQQAEGIGAERALRFVSEVTERLEDSP